MQEADIEVWMKYALDMAGMYSKMWGITDQIDELRGVGFEALAVLISKGIRESESISKINIDNYMKIILKGRIMDSARKILEGKRKVCFIDNDILSEIQAEPVDHSRAELMDELRVAVSKMPGGNEKRLMDCFFELGGDVPLKEHHAKLGMSPWVFWSTRNRAMEMIKTILWGGY